MTEESKIAQLLIKRIKVINDWPDYQIPIGTIMYVHTFDNGNTTYVSNPEVIIRGWNLKTKDAETMPHLFKPLPWWEDRDQIDIRIIRYVKDRSGRVYELLGWDIKDDVINALTLIAPYVIHVPHLFPATKAEYNTYVNNNPK